MRSQSLRKSGRFFHLPALLSKGRITERLNPFVSQVGFFEEYILRAPERVALSLNPFVSQVGFFLERRPGTLRGHRRSQSLRKSGRFFRRD